MGRALVSFRIPQQENLHFGAIGVELSSHYQTIATVVSQAAEDHETFLPKGWKEGVNHIIDGVAGVFHQQLFDDAVPFDRLAIQITHLGDTADFHLTPPREKYHFILPYTADGCKLGIRNQRRLWRFFLSHRR